MNEDSQRARCRLALLFVAVFILSVLVVFVTSDAADPLSRFKNVVRTPDGGISIKGGLTGAEWGALQNLLWPPPPKTDYTVYMQVRSGYPTLEIRGYTYDLYRGEYTQRPEPNSLGKLFVRVGAFFWEGIRGALSEVFDFFTTTARADEPGAAAYKDTSGLGANFPKTFDWTGSAWGDEFELATAGAGVTNVRVVWDPASGSTIYYILVTVNTLATVYRCTADNTCSSDVTATITTVGAAPERHADIAVEQSSGEVLLVYDCSTANANDFCYKTRTAGSWSGELTLDHLSVSNAGEESMSFIQLASNPGSDRIGLGAFDTTNDDFVVAVWNASSWVNADKAVTTAGTLTNGWNGTIFAEDGADEFVAIAGEATNHIRCEWTSAGGWEASCETIGNGTNEDIKAADSRSLPGTNTAIYFYSTDLADTDIVVWDGVSGTGGTGTLTKITNNDGTGTTISLAVGCDWNPDQTTTRDAICVWYNATSTQLAWLTVDDSTNGTTAGSGTLVTGGTSFWVQAWGTRDAADTNRVHIGAVDSVFDVQFYTWNGSTTVPGSRTIHSADTTDQAYPYFGFARQTTAAQSGWYLVLGDADCTVTAIATDAGCWAATSGGAAPTTVPTTASNVFMDGNSGAGTGTLDGSLNVTTGTYSSSGFGGTFALATSTFQNTGTFTHSGGTITISTGALDVGAAAVSASVTTSGAASITMDGLTLSANTIAKGTASLTIQGDLTMSGGDLTSTSGTASVTGNVNISAATSAIDFGSESWTVSGTWTNATTDGAVWDAGTGTILFDSATGGTMVFANANLSEPEFNNATFTSSAGTSQTFTLSTRGLRWGATLTLTDTSGGTVLAKATLPLTGGALTVSGTAASGLTSTSGAVAVSTVSISTTTAYTVFGSESWTVSGTWTNATTNSTWDMGSGTVTFNSATGGTMTFAGANLAEQEFFNAVFESSAGTSQTFTMAARGLSVGNNLTIQDSSGGTILDKATFTLDVVSTLNPAGSAASGLVSTSGNVTATAVNVSTATAYIDLGSENWTVAGNWTNASTNASWDRGSGTTTFNSPIGATLIFAGTNLAEDELTNVTITSTAATLQTFTLSTRGMRISGTLTVTDTSGGSILAKSTLATTVGALTVSGTVASGVTSTSGDSTVNGNVSVSTATAYTDFGSESWIVTGTWTNSTTSASWDAGTGTITFTSATGGTMTFAGSNLAEAEFNSVTFDSSAVTAQSFAMSTRGLRWLTTLSVTESTAGTTELSTAGLALGDSTDTPGVSIGNGGVLTAGASTVSINSMLMTGGTSGILAVSTGAWTVGGSWNTSGVGSTYTQGTGIVTFNVSGTITMLVGDETFDDLTVSGGTVTLASAVVVTNVLIVSGGTFAKATFALTSVGALTMSGGDLTSTSGAVVVAGAVNISSAASAIDFGSETWTVSGTWTNASTDGTVWEAGTGSVLFDSATGGTMTFAGTNLSEAEFDDVSFTSSAGTAQTFTMATRGLRWLTTLTVSDAASTTELATANLALGAAADAADIVVGNGGILTTNASTVVVNGVTTTGGASGTITVTTGAWTVSGNWNTSGAGSIFTEGTTSTYEFNATASITLLSTDNTFSALTVSAGTVTLATNTVVTNTLTVSGGLLAKSTFTITAAALTMSGGDLTSTSGTMTVNGNVNISSASSAIAFGSEAWNISGTWTNASTDGAVWDAGTATVTFTSATGGTMTFAGMNLAEAEFNSVVFTSSAGTPQTFTMATRGLRWLTTLSITDGSSTTALATADLALGNVADTPSISIGNGGTLTANASTVSVVDVTMTGGTNGTLTLTAGAWTVAGDWNTSGTGSTFAEGSSTVTMTGAGRSITLLSTDDTFSNLTIAAAGTVTVASDLNVSGTLTVNSGALFALATFVVVITTLAAVAGGISAGASGGKTVNSNVTVNAAGYFSFGGAPWEFKGTWTNNSTSASWDKGGATVLFSSATGGTMTFGDTTNYVGGVEFSSVTFTSSAGTPQTFTMATNALKASGTLTVTDGSSTTTLTSSNLDLQANDVECGTNGVINIGTGDFKSLVTFNIDGSLTMDGVTVGNMYINRTAGGGTIDITLWTAWTVGGDVDVRWTFTPSVAGDTWQFVLEDVGNTVSYDLKRNAVVIDTQTSVVTTVTLSKATGWAAGDAMAIDETPTGCSTTCYWFGGTGNWNDGTHWGDASGGGASGAVPTGASAVVFDANSGVGTVTVDVNAAMASFNSTGSSITTIAIGTFNFAVGGATVHAAGSITIGSSAGTGLTVTGSLTISGSASISAGTATEIVDIDGGVNVSSATAFIDLGAGMWNVGGSWTNSSTSASWDAGTGTTTFDSVAGATMTFAGTNLSEDEFRSVVFTSSAGTPQTFTMATRGLRFGGTLSITDGSSTTALATGGFTLDGGAISVGNGGILTANSSVASVSTFTMTGGSSGVLTLTSGVWTVTGGWDSSGTGSTFTEGTATMQFNGTQSVTLLSSDNTFNIMTVQGGTVTMGSAWIVTNALTISGGTLAKNTRTFTAGSLTMSGGDLTSTSGTVAVAGNVNISSASSAIAFGSESWTVSGTWTNASTDGAVWDKGSGSMLFDSATGGTMTFAGANLAEAEFFDVTFTSSAGTPQTFTMATRGLVVSGAFTLSDGSSTTTFDTSGSNLSVDATDFHVNVGGGFTANGSTITVSGIWACGAGFSSGTSTVVWTGTGTADFNHAFNILESTGGTRQINDTLVAVTFEISGGVVTFGDLGGFDLFAFGDMDLIMSGGDLDATGSLQAPFFLRNVTISSASSAMKLNNLTGTLDWRVSGTWSNASTDSAFWDAGTSWVTFTSATGGTMTFAGSNLSEAEFLNVIFTSSAGTPQTFTMVTRGLRWGGTLTITDATSTTELDNGTNTLGLTGGTLVVEGGGILTSNASAVSISDVTMTSATSGTITLTSGSWTVSGNWNTSGAGTTFTKGTSTVMMSGTTKTVSIRNTSNGFASLTITGTITMLTAIDVSVATSISGTLVTGGLAFSGAGALTISTGGIFTANASTVTVSDVTMTSAVSGTITLTTGVWTVSGNWDTSGTGTTFVKGTSTITMSGTTKTVAIRNASNGFYRLTISGTVSQTTAIDVSNTLESSGSGTLTTSGNNITGGGAVVLAGAGGIVGSTSSITVGAVTVGAGTTFSVSSGTIDTTNGNVSVTGTLTVSGAGFLTFGGGNLTINNGGIVNGNAATVTVTDVTMTGGVSGTLTLTSGSWTVHGNWDTSGAGSTFTQGTSTITMDGTGKTLKMLAAQLFDTLIIAGAVSLLSNGRAKTFTINGSKTLTMTGFSVVFNHLDVSAANASIIDGAVTVTNFDVTNSDPAALTTISTFTVWILATQQKWTHTSDTPTSTMTFTITGNVGSVTFNVTKDAIFFTSGLVVAGVVTFTMLGSDPVVDVTEATPACGPNCYWVGGTGDWSDAGHWASSSGGPGGTGVPAAGDNVFFDGASGVGTTTIDADTAVITSLDMTGFAGTIDLSTNLLTMTGMLYVEGTLDMATGTARFGSLLVSASGSLIMDGFTIQDAFMSTSAGTILLTQWILYGLPTPTQIEWVFDPSVPAATVTITFGGLQPNKNYDLLRDGVTVQTMAADGVGSVTFAVTGGWSSHNMVIQEAGGGGGQIPKETILVNAIGGYTYSFTLKVNGQILSVLWNFGDGTSQETRGNEPVFHSYSLSGDYIVTVAVIKVDGKTTILTKTITVLPQTSLLGYVVLFLTILFLVGAFSIKNEPTKIVLSYFALVFAFITLGFQSKPDLTTVGSTAMNYLILAVIASGFLLSFMPTKNAKRARGAWFLFGVVALALWYFLK